MSFTNGDEPPDLTIADEPVDTLLLRQEAWLLRQQLQATIELDNAEIQKLWGNIETLEVRLEDAEQRASDSQLTLAAVLQSVQDLRAEMKMEIRSAVMDMREDLSAELSAGVKGIRKDVRKTGAKSKATAPDESATPADESNQINAPIAAAVHNHDALAVQQSNKLATAAQEAGKTQQAGKPVNFEKPAAAAASNAQHASLSMPASAAKPQHTIAASKHDAAVHPGAAAAQKHANLAAHTMQQPQPRQGAMTTSMGMNTSQWPEFVGPMPLGRSLSASQAAAARQPAAAAPAVHQPAVGGSSGGWQATMAEQNACTLCSKRFSCRADRLAHDYMPPHNELLSSVKKGMQYQPGFEGPPFLQSCFCDACSRVFKAPIDFAQHLLSDGHRTTLRRVWLEEVAKERGAEFAKTMENVTPHILPPRRMAATHSQRHSSPQGHKRAAATMSGSAAKRRRSHSPH